jgi:hypothetical protein
MVGENSESDSSPFFEKVFPESFFGLGLELFAG